MQADQDTTQTPSLDIAQEETIAEQKVEETLPAENLEAFLLGFEQTKDVEEKIRRAIAFMRERLSGSTSPRFREFWEVRKLCLPVFKESLPVRTRADLWQEYIDLSVEARRLKEILDEQSAFAYEQIDLAVQSLIKDLESYGEKVAKASDITLLNDLLALSAKKDQYNTYQKELHLLNAFAAKVSALRKEIIKTDMRIRSKNKLFERLSACGDQIFPRRKELIRIVSEDFLEDVGAFVAKNFSPTQGVRGPLHALREEIKGLQAVAKVLTLNTHSFTETRTKLSGCWDMVKTKEKEKKKEFNEKRAIFQQNLEQAEELIKPFEELCSTTEDLAAVDKAVSELSLVLREIELGRFEQRAIQEKIDLARKPHEEKREKLAKEQQEKERAAEQERLEKVQSFRTSLQEVLDGTVGVDSESLQNAKSEKEEEYKVLNISKAERVLLDRMFKQLKDRILEAKGAALLSLSDDEQKQYEGLLEILGEKKERRAEMKNQLEVYRKALGGSGFDFEKAMTYQELMQVEKKSLEQIDKDIQEIERKIEELKG